MSTLCFINGKIKNIDEGFIGIRDIGLQRGYAVFDFVRTFQGKLFHFEDHLQRFKRSAEELGLQLNYSDGEIKETAERIINGSDLQNPAVRLILTGGYSYSSPGNLTPNFIMIAEELPVYPGELYTNGIKLVTYKFLRELPHIKSINYLTDIKLNSLRCSKNAYDVLYFSEQGITECPRSNFFIFKKDKLVTPKDSLLYGVTRKVVLGIAKEFWKVEERKIDLPGLKEVDEAFITSTTKNVMPVTEIDDYKIGNAEVGEQTKKLMQLFDLYIEQYLRAAP